MTEHLSHRSLSAERVAEYERLCEGRPDAISILARSVHVKGAARIEKTGGYADRELNDSVSGSHARVIAAMELHAAFPGSVIITNSTVERTGEEHARVTAAELERSGVAKADIVQQAASYNTYTEILELVRLIVEHQWRAVVVIVNEYQARRAEAFLKQIQRLDDPQQYWKKPEIYAALEEFKKMQDVTVKFVTAEQVLEGVSARHQALIGQVRSLPEYQAAIAEDERSSKQVHEGSYWGRPFRTNQ